MGPGGLGGMTFLACCTAVQEQMIGEYFLRLLSLCCAGSVGWDGR
jgi:hypothetical protein